MASPKQAKRPVKKTAAASKPPAAKKLAAQAKAAPAVKKKSTTAARPAKPAQAGGNKGLITFGVVVGAVILLAVVGKLRQGPPIKLLPVQVQATYAVAEGTIPPLSSPRGIAVDGTGALYVTDLGTHRLVKFNADGTLDKAWGTPGDKPGQFKEPSGVAVDAQGSVFVADAWNGRIEKFTAQGEYLGEIGSKAGNFYSPRNVAVDAQGFIYVADTGNSCVKKFDADGNLVKRWGEFGPGRDRFQETFGVWVDKKNQVYVGDAGNRRIKIYTADGKYLREIRPKGWRTGTSWPLVAVDPAGRVFASDVQNNMIWIYDAQGKYLGSWGNQPGKDNFAAPMGLTIDSAGSVYVANMNRGQVVKLAPLPQ
jgi:DNA-binding beta-propeller fold protein YncE